MNRITLNNGVAIPQVGLGTYLLEPDDAQSAVTYALDNGYTLIDTANVYVNERAVGRGMRASSKARDEIFLETKLWPSFFERPTAVDETLERLGTDYIDLMILHQPTGDTVAGYRILEKAYKEGKIRAIGLSNFDVAQTQRILDECEVVPTINQVECHPYFPQTELKALLAEHNIALQAWYPLGGRGNDSIMSESLVQELAEKHGKSPRPGAAALAYPAGTHRDPGLEDTIAHRSEHRPVRLHADRRGHGPDRLPRQGEAVLRAQRRGLGRVPRIRARRGGPEVVPFPARPSAAHDCVI